MTTSGNEKQPEPQAKRPPVFPSQAGAAASLLLRYERAPVQAGEATLGGASFGGHRLPGPGGTAFAPGA